MRSSRATWILVALSATALCVETGCMGSRIGRGIAAVPRPHLMGRWRGDGDKEIASTKPKPPASSVPPIGLANAGAGARSFPGEPAPESTGTPATYASTGSGDGYLATSAPTRGYESTGAAQPQQGFYGTEPSGSSDRYAQTPARGGADYNSPSAPRGYDARDSYGGDSGADGSRSDYSQPYAGSGTRGYEEVADARGGDYNYDGGQPNDYSAGASRYDTPGADSHYVSPQGGGGDYGYQNPAPSRYSGGYDEGNYNSSGDSYSRFSSGDGASAGGGYESTPAYGSQPSGAGSYGTGGYNSPSPARPASFLPGSTKPYNAQPLTPPTSGSYGSGNRN